MADYITPINYTAKDSPTSADPKNISRGADFQTEFDALAIASATKADLSSPTFTGTVTVPNLTVTGTFSATVDGGTY